MHRVLVALQFVHVLSLINLVVITYFRFDHNGKTCFCHYDVPTEYENACMTNIRFIIELFIGALWAFVLLFCLAALVLACSMCCRRKSNKKGGSATADDDADEERQVSFASTESQSQALLH